MTHDPTITRRTLVRSAALGLVAVPFTGIAATYRGLRSSDTLPDPERRYPSIADDLVAEMVGVSHFDRDRVSELLSTRPELARATWDWGFGDWETALGAASHVGRRDIAELLIEHGARPDIFTYAMMGRYNAVRAMVEARPGVQRVAGPHGISLLQHTIIGSHGEGLSTAEKEDCLRLVAYLEELGDAGSKVLDVPMPDVEKEKFLGDYRYGEAAGEGLSVSRNMRGMLALGRLGEFGGGLFHQGNNTFTYNGVTSVTIRFDVEGDLVHALTIEEPGLVLKARKV